MTQMPDLQLNKVLRAMDHDKKIVGGRLRFVLPKAIGDVFITDEVSSSLVEQVLAGWNE